VRSFALAQPQQARPESDASSKVWTVLPAAMELTAARHGAGLPVDHAKMNDEISINDNVIWFGEINEMGEIGADKEIECEWIRS
jgi:hypothetical protein